jgi:two-component SAPR family response regulator
MITVSGGRVSLDERRCWVDVRALECHLDQIDQLNKDPVSLLSHVEKLMSLYRGPFLGDEEGAWSQQLRRRLRSKFSRFIACCGQILITSGEGQQAMGLLARAKEIDSGSEDIGLGAIANYDS